ncbi:hypothetical protein DPMN_014391 [Dreissena polymorpha]|uniref:Uncharacterized protein n=1 Tax=Dreissena polymorpha TaxID=45954 RepID=A0A9D4N776_DREPO|nr:hypothetical protein DPMN_014391 [Dreissena polymorpha]
MGGGILGCDGWRGVVVIFERNAARWVKNKPWNPLQQWRAVADVTIMYKAKQCTTSEFPAKVDDDDDAGRDMKGCAFHWSQAGLAERATTDATRRLVDYISRQWVHGGSFEPSDWSVFRQDVRSNLHRITTTRSAKVQKFLVSLWDKYEARECTTSEFLAKGGVRLRIGRSKVRAPWGAFVEGWMFVMGLVPIWPARKPRALNINVIGCAESYSHISRFGA